MAPVIPIFFACDNNFIKYTVVALHSMIKNADKTRRYEVYVLHTNATPEMEEMLKALENEQFHVTFVDVKEYLDSISEKLPLRDYYSQTTYFRFFIADMFPQYDKAIYIDSDTVVQGDIAKLFDTEIGDAYVGACHEQAMVQDEVFGTYCEKVVGVSRYEFFNAGMMLLNCRQFREGRVLDSFIEYLHTYHFVVTQDEDYLNLICKDRVFWLDQRWNTPVAYELPYPMEEAFVVHYIMVHKPWHYADCRHGEIFWRYAEETAVVGMMKEELLSYTEEQKERDKTSCQNLRLLALREIEREDNFLNRLNATRDAERVAVVKRIEALEREGNFLKDVENDPPTKPLLPHEIDYFRRSFLAKCKQRHAYHLAKKFVRRMLKEQKLQIKEIVGEEHFREMAGGAVVTCNHFNAFDSFAMQLAYMKAGVRKKKLYRVIREGNYTSFGGFYGYLMRHFYTLPLSSNRKTMQKFLSATQELLRAGNFVLIYPEQSMWWNYRKPKPLQKGAYSIAAKSGVPVLPCFITMRDSDIIGEDGFFIQEYTVHVAPPIYPKKEYSYAENVAYLQEQNAAVWKEIYEKTYGIPLRFETERKEEADAV